MQHHAMMVRSKTMASIKNLPWLRSPDSRGQFASPLRCPNAAETPPSPRFSASKKLRGSKTPCFGESPGWKIEVSIHFNSSWFRTFEQHEKMSTVANQLRWMIPTEYHPKCLNDEVLWMSILTCPFQQGNMRFAASCCSEDLINGRCESRERGESLDARCRYFTSRWSDGQIPLYLFSSWWFQPLWKICSSKWVNLPQIPKLGWTWKIFETTQFLLGR